MMSPTTYYTVTRLNQLVRQLLEHELGSIWLTAEISNFSQPVSGHWYFTLKDDRSQVRCAMFRGLNQGVTFQPQNGQQVLVRANITLYEPRGDYQLIIEQMKPAGEGALQQQFELLKQKLSLEGLFAAERKKALPNPATCVGIITSATGAALHDILQVLQRRDPALPVIIYPTIVQGDDAAAQIVRAIELANRRRECDVLIVGRGGGSLEDLNCFNQESVARAVFASKIPIVSAVGHEVDVTIIDFVADVRAPTPSAAAEIVSRNQLELLRRLQSKQQQLSMAMDYYLLQKQRNYSQWSHRLKQQHPTLRLSRQHNILLKLQQQLSRAIKKQLNHSQLRYQQDHQRFSQWQPQMILQQHRQQLIQYRYDMQQSIQTQLHTLSQRFAVCCSQLEAVSPLATMARGYSITTNQQGLLLRSRSQVKLQQTIYTRLADAIIESEITAITAQKPSHFNGSSK